VLAVDALWGNNERIDVPKKGLESCELSLAQSIASAADTRPSQQMNVEERLVADYAGTGLTVGKHPMHYRRPELRRSNILSAENYGPAATENSYV
jgi:hypothetical protein